MIKFGDQLCCRGSYLGKDYKIFIDSIQESIKKWENCSPNNVDELLNIIRDYPAYFPLHAISNFTYTDKVRQIVKIYYYSGRLDNCLRVIEIFKKELLLIEEIVTIYLKILIYKETSPQHFLDTLNELSAFLSERTVKEFKSSILREISPSLEMNMEMLQCTSCFADKMVIDIHLKNIKCSCCTKTFPIQQGIPIMLYQELDSYMNMEPVYQESYKDVAPGNKPGFDRFPRFVNVLIANKGVGNLQKQKSLLTGKYHEVPVWNQLQIFFKQFDKNKNLKVLDVGCGLAHDIFALSELYPSYDFFGVDIVLPGVQNAHKFKGNRRNQYFCADGSRLPFVNESFDIVISTYSIEHAGNALMREVERVLKRKGKAFVAGPSEKNYISLHLMALQGYLKSVNMNCKFNTHGVSELEYKQMFEGFNIEKHSSDNYIFRFLLENDVINQMNFDAAELIFEEACNVIGKQLDMSENTRWYNYIQIFYLSKK